MQPPKNAFDQYSTLQDTRPTQKARPKNPKRGAFPLLGIISILTLTLVPNSIALTLETGCFGQHERQSRGLPLPRATENGTDFDWQQLIPSPELKWVPCLTGRECARLEVPLDYTIPDGDKSAIALLRVKSKVSHDSEEYRGPVLINPGGPGGSGVAFANGVGEMLQQLLGDGYDIVGFDPRGIGETTPAVSIFPDEVERAYWDAGSPPLLNSTANALPRAFSRAQLFNELVEVRSKQAAQHVSTSVVARDMLSITKAHGRDKLQYWGVSYGTVLGATYAAMFPDHVERLIIDGVVDFDDYYSGALSHALLDADKALNFLYDKCASAGPACPLHAPSGALVKQRVDALLASIKANPVPAISGANYGLIDFSILKQALFQALYTPFSAFPPLATALAALEGGNGVPFLSLWRNLQPLPKCDTPTPLGSPREEAGLAVRCGDAAHVANTTSDIMQLFEELSKFSIFADVRTDSTYTACAGWRVRPTERFAGPFAVNTSFPLLVIGNTADPATPLAGAQKAARAFTGSVLLTINTPGHTSNAATSLCTQNIIRNYFTQGVLPEEGTVCEIENVLFGEASGSAPNSTAPSLLAGDTTMQDVENLRTSPHFHAARGWRLV